MGIQPNAEFWGAQAASLPSTSVKLLDQRNISAGKLAAVAGWQSALPRKLK